MYVDDILLTGSSSAYLKEFISTLQRQFAMKDFGPLHYFFYIQITQTSNGLLLSQNKYALYILAYDQMHDCKPMATPMMPKTKNLNSSTPFSDLAHYRNIVGALLYLMLTCPDISYSVNFVTQFMHSLTDAH